MTKIFKDFIQNIRIIRASTILEMSIIDAFEILINDINEAISDVLFNTDIREKISE
jgi:hypothetical protein|tara:strand:- start:244 stop:411 length:168 start_codon:yes stop_codon:yes gene_type:complete